MAASCTVGHLGALAVRAPTTEAANHTPTTTHVLIYSYDTREHLETWQSHPARKKMVERVRALLVPSASTEVSMRVFDSCKFCLFFFLLCFLLLFLLFLCSW